MTAPVAQVPSHQRALTDRPILLLGANAPATHAVRENASSSAAHQDKLQRVVTEDEAQAPGSPSLEPCGVQ
jgi:hypothetical protein